VLGRCGLEEWATRLQMRSEAFDELLKTRRTIVPDQRPGPASPRLEPIERDLCTTSIRTGPLPAPTRRRGPLLLLAGIRTQWKRSLARQRTGSSPGSARRSSGILRRPTPITSSRNSARCSASNGVPIQEISDTVGHMSILVTETVYRHVIVSEIRGGATVRTASSATSSTTLTRAIKAQRHFGPWFGT
jgi:hypothetical protein